MPSSDVVRSRRHEEPGLRANLRNLDFGSPAQKGRRLTRDQRYGSPVERDRSRPTLADAGLARGLPSGEHSPYWKLSSESSRGLAELSRRCGPPGSGHAGASARFSDRVHGWRLHRQTECGVPLYFIGDQRWAPVAQACGGPIFSAELLFLSQFRTCSNPHCLPASTWQLETSLTRAPIQTRSRRSSRRRAPAGFMFHVKPSRNLKQRGPRVVIQPRPPTTETTGRSASSSDVVDPVAHRLERHRVGDP